MIVKDENYYTVFGWMLNRLHLKGNDLKIYALIYSFSQDGKSEYKGSLGYLTEFTGTSNATVKRSLTRLEEIGYIEKTDRNAATGGTNTFKAVPLDKVFMLNEGVAQNDLPPSSKRAAPEAQNDLPPSSKRATIITSGSNSSNNNSLDKERKKESSQGVSNKPSAHVRESYDDLILKFNLSDAERKSVFEFIRHCQLNGHTLTNDALTRSLEALTSYPAERRCSAVRDAIDRNRYALKPLTEKHYDMFGTGNNERRDYQTVMEDSLKEYLGENADFVISKLWEFIQHCAANGQRMTNDRLLNLCIKLKKLYRTSEPAEMRKALDKAISGGYYDIKDGEGWIAESIAYRQAMGLPKPFESKSESNNGG